MEDENNSVEEKAPSHPADLAFTKPELNMYNNV